jgi:bacillithiol system protein YtxJ
MFLRKKAKSKNDIWLTLDSASKLDEIIKNSNEKTQVIFKHSTRCSISDVAKSRLDSGWNYEKEQVDLYYLDLLSHRSVSNLIESKLGVVHESPQMIVIKNEKVILHESHGAIYPSLLAKAV